MPAWLSNENFGEVRSQEWVSACRTSLLWYHCSPVIRTITSQWRVVGPRVRESPGTAIQHLPCTSFWSINCLRSSKRCFNKRRTTAGPYMWLSYFFKDDDVILASESTKLFGSIWENEWIPMDLDEPVIVSTYKKGYRRLCESHRGVSFVYIAFRAFAEKVNVRIKPVLNSEETIHHTFTILHVSERGCTFRRSCNFSHSQY